MRKPCFALLLFVLLVFGLYLTVPAEDLPETGYDESEAFPYESTPLFSNVISQAAVSTTGGVRSVARPRSRTPFRLAATRITDRDSHQFAKAQVARALLCTLLC